MSTYEVSGERKESCSFLPLPTPPNKDEKKVLTVKSLGIKPHHFYANSIKFLCRERESEEKRQNENQKLTRLLIL